MTIERIDDYFAHSKDLFIQVFRDKPRLNVILKAFARQADELEAVFWQILDARNIDKAVGIQLDIIGKLVGQPRVGTDDEVYRLYLKARIRSNRSSGKNIDIFALMELMLGVDTFEIRDLYPASFVADALVAIDPELAPSMGLFVHLATSAGIGSSLHWSDSDPDNCFTWAPGTERIEDVARGWGDAQETDVGTLVDDAETGSPEITDERGATIVMGTGGVMIGVS